MVVIRSAFDSVLSSFMNTLPSMKPNLSWLSPLVTFDLSLDGNRQEVSISLAAKRAVDSGLGSKLCICSLGPDRLELREKKVLSMPVVDVRDRSKLLGLVGMVDFCAFVIHLFDRLKGYETISFNAMFTKELQNRKVVDLINFSGVNVCKPLKEDATLREIMETLSLPGVHRAPLIAQARAGLLSTKIVLGRLVTQSDIIRFIATHVEEFGAVMSTPVPLLGTKTAVVVDARLPAIDAFAKLLESKVSGFPVVNDKRELVAAMSDRDVRAIVERQPHLELKKPISEFLDDLHDHDEAAKPVLCTYDDDLRTVVTKLNSNKAHRAFVMDGKQPVAVISPSDIFRLLAKAEWKPVPTRPRGPSAVSSMSLDADRRRLEKVALRAMASDSSESASRDTSREETSSDVVGRSESSTERPLPDFHPSRVKFLQEKLSKVLPRQKVEEILRVDGTASAKDAAQLLSEHGILSIPLMDANHKLRLVGLVDLVDICAYILTILIEYRPSPHSNVFADLFDAKLKSKSVQDLSNFSGQNEMWVLGPDATTLQVLTTLSQPNVKRVPILTKQHKLKRFVTQSELLSLVANHFDDFGPIMNYTIKECNLGYYRPADELGISVDKLTFDAFVALIEKRSPAIAVLGAKQKVCGAIAVRDVRRVTGHQAARELAKPLSAFIEDQSVGSSQERSRSALTCFSGESLRTVIEKMNVNKMHCCFIVDQHDDHLKGVLTLVEVFRFLLRR